MIIKNRSSPQQFKFSQQQGLKPTKHRNYFKLFSRPPFNSMKPKPNRRLALRPMKLHSHNILE